MLRETSHTPGLPLHKVPTLSVEAESGVMLSQGLRGESGFCSFRGWGVVCVSQHLCRGQVTMRIKIRSSDLAAIAISH